MKFMLTCAIPMTRNNGRANFMEDFFGSVLIDRGDRESWTGDAHPIQAAALVAFHNLDSIKQNLKASISGAGGGFPTYVRVDNSVAPPPPAAPGL